MPFTSTIDPVLLQLGPFAIRYYGLAYVLGFLFGWWWLKRAARMGKLKLTDKQIEDLIFWLMVGVVAGARFGHVLFWNLPYFLSHPLKIFAVWEGGMAFHGGLIGIIVAGWFFSRKHDISFLRLADIITIPAVFALALGRIANFANAELYGPITDASWCVNFPSIEGCRHPYQLYSALKRTTIGVLLLMLAQKPQKDGTIFWCFLWLISAGRFMLDFLRVDTRWLGFSIGQYLSLTVLIVATFALLRTRKII